MRYFLILLVGILAGWFAREVKYMQADSVLVPVDVAVFLPDTPDKLRAEYVEQNLGSADTGDYIELLHGYLKKQDFEAITEVFELLQQEADADRLDEANEVVYRFVRELLSAKDNRSAQSLLNHYLGIFNRNVTARLLLVEVLIRLAEYQSAIDQLYLAKGHAFRADTFTLINKKIHSLVNKHASILRQNSEFRDLLVFYEKLTQQEADYAPYFIGLAEAQIAIGDFDAAMVSLQMIASDMNVGRRASVMLYELKQRQLAADSENEPVQGDAEMASTVALHKQGNHYLVDAYSSKGEALRLLIDTGASLTILTPDALLKHNIEYKDKGEIQQFNTANGVVNAPVYELESLSIGKWEVEGISIAVLDLQGSEGLLGMNFLQYFQFFIDQKQSKLHLSLRK